MTSKNRLGTWAFLVSLSLMLSSPAASEQERQGSGIIVAIVNGSVITGDMLEREMAAVRQRGLLPGEPGEGPQLAQMRARVLESLIDIELLLQEARKKGYGVAEASVSEQLKNVKEQFATEKEFQEALRQANVTIEVLKDKIRRDLTLQRFTDGEFIQKAEVTEEEAKAYYDAHGDSFKLPEEMRASHILVRVDAAAGPEQKAEARKKIEGARKRVQEGEDFAALAKELSDDPNGAAGGDLGYFARGQMVQPFEDAAFALKPGDISGIVETPFGYHLIQCVEIRPETTMSYPQVEPKLKEYLKQQKARDALQGCLADLRKKAQVERLLPPEGR